MKDTTHTAEQIIRKLLRWSGSSVQVQSLTSETGHRSLNGARIDELAPTHSPEFKARFAMQAISGRKRILEIAADQAIHGCWPQA
jgi:hypothetical protein